MTADTDRHLLLGLLALQTGIVNQGQLVAAFQAWTLDKSKSLADHLEARGDLTRAKRAVLEQLAEVRRSARAGAGEGAETIYGNWMIYYDAACVHAGLAQLALQDQASPPTERQRLAQQDYDHALELLGKSRVTCELTDMISLDEIRRERLLDPLRSDPRFQLLFRRKGTAAQANPRLALKPAQRTPPQTSLGSAPRGASTPAGSHGSH